MRLNVKEQDTLGPLVMRGTPIVGSVPKDNERMRRL